MAQCKGPEFSPQTANHHHHNNQVTLWHQVKCHVERITQSSAASEVLRPPEGPLPSLESGAGWGEVGQARGAQQEIARPI